MSYFKEWEGRYFLALLLNSVPPSRTCSELSVQRTRHCCAQIRISAYTLWLTRKAQGDDARHLEGCSKFDWNRGRKEPTRESCVLSGLVYPVAGPSLSNKDVLTLAILRGEIMHTVTD